MDRLFRLLTNRAVWAAIFTIAGAIALAFGKTLAVEDSIIDSIVVIAGAVSTAFGYGIALTTPTKKI